MQESRLFRTLYILLERGQVTAPELAQEFEVSVRTIYRDVDALSAAGIPICCTQGKGGGISLLEGFVLNKGILSQQEQQTITSALQSLSALLPEAENKLLPKLNGLFRQNNPDWIQIDFSRWGNQNVDQEKFAAIKSAILNRQILTFQYINSYGRAGERRVKPLRICYKSHAWYLQAYCMEKSDFRIFKINRMTHPMSLPDVFEDFLLPPPIEIAADDDAYPYIKLCFNKEIAYRVYDEFNSLDITEAENGDLIVETHIPQDSWLFSYLLSFSGNVDILEPAHVKNRFNNFIKEIYGHYFK